MNWNNLKKVLHAVDDRVTENAYARGRRWVPERESVAPTTRRNVAPKKSVGAALAR